MRFFACVLLLVIVLAISFESAFGQSRIDRSAAWFKPAPKVRSPQFSRSRLSASRLLPRRMYRSLPNNYDSVVDQLDEGSFVDAE